MNIPVSGPILTIKAKELALKLGHRDFICCSGWLQRFKWRHDIVFRKVAGEEGSVSEEMLRDWKSRQLPDLLETFSPDDIFLIQMRLECLPDKTVSLKGVVEVREVKIE